MSSPDEYGFLGIQDLIERQKTTSIFSVPEKEQDDIMSQLESQENKNGIFFDLRLGKEYFLSGEKKPGILSDASPWLTIEPGQFALLTTYELLQMPNNLIALISMRNNKKAGGLINISGFHVDPSFDGLLVFSVYNAGPTPIPLKYKEETFMIGFVKTREVQMSKKPRQTSLEQKYWNKIIGVLPVSPQSLDTRIKELEPLIGKVESIERITGRMRLLEKVLYGAIGLLGILIVNLLSGGSLTNGIVKILGGHT